MARLRHGYTNQTRRRAGTVEKTYVGAHRFERARTELACLAALGDRLAVPPVIDVHLDVPRLTVGALAGHHGQDLIDRGRADVVLGLAGASLAALARIPASTVTGLEGRGPHLVHGDFGPQNLLVDPDAGRITGILDWEFAHRGDAIEDVAWAEWIVRMHHPHAVDDLEALFLGFGRRPSWRQRHDEMLRRVRQLVAASPPASTSPWRERLEATERWSE